MGREGRSAPPRRACPLQSHGDECLPGRIMAEPQKVMPPKKNLMSSLTWLLLGQLMVTHHRWNPMTKKAHEGFGYSLMGLAAAKALDVLTNSSTSGGRATDIRSLRFLPALVCLPN